MRKSNIELLRILAMLLIVLSHWGGHGSWTYENSLNLLYGGYIQYTQFFGEVGNCVFILITGYFLAERNEIRLGGVKNIIIDVKFYAFILWLVLIVFGVNDFSIGKMALALFPVIYNQYWFVLPYIVTLLLSPYINRFIKESSLLEFKWFLIILITLEIILPTLKAPTICSNTGLFILYYSVGVLIKTERLPLKLNNFTRIFMVCVGILPLIMIVVNEMIFAQKGYSIISFDSKWWRFSPFPLVSSIGLFSIFSSFNMSSSIVNILAKSVFAVYLISENPNVYNWLWKIDCLDNITYIESPFFILISLFQCLSIMAICILIDMCYRKLRTMVHV